MGTLRGDCDDTAAEMDSLRMTLRLSTEKVASQRLCFDGSEVLSCDAMH